MQLADVERLALEASKSYGHARIRLDPWQGIGLALRLRDRGVSVEEWSFTAQSVGRLGANLHVLLRDHRLALPDDQELLDELMTVRVRESAPGVYRLDHDSGQHDDRAVSLGLAALALTELTERTDSDLGSFTVPRGVVTRAGGRGDTPGPPWGAQSGVRRTSHSGERSVCLRGPTGSNTGTAPRWSRANSPANRKRPFSVRPQPGRQRFR